MKKWFVRFFYRSRIYFYGPILIVLELVLRSGLHTEVQAFVGPSIAAAGASAIVLLTLEKPLTPERQKKLADKFGDKLDLIMQHQEVTITFVREKNFIGVCWTFVLLCTGAWFRSLYLSLAEPNNTYLFLPVNYWPGIVVFVISVVLSEVREELI